MVGIGKPLQQSYDHRVGYLWWHRSGYYGTEVLL